MPTTHHTDHESRRTQHRFACPRCPWATARVRRPAPRAGWQRLRDALFGYSTVSGSGSDRHGPTSRQVRAEQCDPRRRSQSTLRERTRDGWWLGPAPYGYAREHHWVEPKSGRAGWRHRLVVDALRAPVVSLIFAWSVHENLSDRAIARRLTDQQHPRPVDPVSGRARTWTPAAVRTILANPVYLGYVVRDRTLRGVDQPPENWTWSRQRSHRALVEPSLFWTVHNRRARWVSPTRDTDTTGLADQSWEAA